MCESSPFGVKIVKLSANIVLHGANTVYTIASLFLVLLFVFLSDPGDLELVMMHRGYVEAKIDKLMQNPAYTEILLMEVQEEAGDKDLPPKKRKKMQAKKGHHELPSLSELAHIGKESEARIEGKAPSAHEGLIGKGPVSADLFNLSDLRQVLRLQEYLQDNASLELFHMPKNGQCLFASVRIALEIPEEYRSNHLRYQLAFFITQNHQFCFNILKKLITFEYGHARLTKAQYLEGMKEGTLTEAQIADYQVPGPFSFIGYLKYILEGSTWGDQGLLTLISMMWQVTITIVNAEDLSQIKIRHQRPLDQVNLVVILAQRCHYLGTCKYDFCFLFLDSAVQCELGTSMVLYSARMIPYSASMVLLSVRMVVH